MVVIDSDMVRITIFFLVDRPVEFLRIQDGETLLPARHRIRNGRPFPVCIESSFTLICGSRTASKKILFETHHNCPLFFIRSTDSTLPLNLDFKSTGNRKFYPLLNCNIKCIKNFKNLYRQRITQ